MTYENRRTKGKRRARLLAGLFRTSAHLGRKDSFRARFPAFVA